MLTKVEIRGFRSCNDLTLDHLGPVVVLVGPNGAGKSNILKAILRSAKFALGAQPLNWPEDSGAGTLEFRIQDRLYKYRHASKIVRAQTPRMELEETIAIGTSQGRWSTLAKRSGSTLEVRGLKLPAGDNLEIDPRAPFLRFLLAYPTASRAKLSHFRRIERFLKAVRYQPFDEPNESNEGPAFVPKHALDEWSARYRVTGDADESVNMKLMHSFYHDREKFDEITALLGSEGLDLVREITVRSVDVGPMPRADGDEAGDLYEYVMFAPSSGPKGGRLLPFGLLSQGTRRIVRMVVSMVFDESSVMLLEHPEDGIHRGLSKRVFSRLKSYTNPGQIIATSHSELVFDMLEPSEVRLVSMVDGATQARALSPEEVDRARRYVNEDGRFSDFLEFNENS